MSVTVSFNVSPEEEQALADLITSADSPVGIDAKKTHILILHKLLAIEQRLSRLEERLGNP
jgi:hypothetical protein